VSLITPGETKTIVGPSGPVVEHPKSARQLREAIASLLAYEESLARVEGDLPVMDYDRAPWIEARSDFQGRPAYIGWHVIEVSNGRGRFRAVLPDARYAKGDLSRYRDALEKRLNWLTDKKFISSMPPGNLRPNAIRMNVDLPPGTAFMIWNDRYTAWADGGPVSRTPLQQSRAQLQAELDRAMRLAVQQAKTLPQFRPRSPSRNNRIDNHAQVMLVYPGGEAQDGYPYADDPDFSKHWSYDGLRERAFRDLSAAGARALAVPDDEMKGAIRHNPPPSRASRSG
jgi:hypothetical protein